MKTLYRGYEINVNREPCMGGWALISYSIFRIRDGFECCSGSTQDESSERTFVGYMKSRVDAELDDIDPWGESKLLATRKAKELKT